MIIHVLSKVGALFLVLFVGGLARYKKIITDEALDSLVKLIEVDLGIPEDQN